MSSDPSLILGESPENRLVSQQPIHGAEGGKEARKLRSRRVPRSGQDVQNPAARKQGFESNPEADSWDHDGSESQRRRPAGKISERAQAMIPSKEKRKKQNSGPADTLSSMTSKQKVALFNKSLDTAKQVCKEFHAEAEKAKQSCATCEKNNEAGARLMSELSFTGDYDDQIKVTIEGMRKKWKSWAKNCVSHGPVNQLDSNSKESIKDKLVSGSPGMASMESFEAFVRTKTPKSVLLNSLLAQSIAERLFNRNFFIVSEMRGGESEANLEQAVRDIYNLGMEVNPEKAKAWRAQTLEMLQYPRSTEADANDRPKFGEETEKSKADYYANMVEDFEKGPAGHILKDSQQQIVVKRKDELRKLIQEAGDYCLRLFSQKAEIRPCGFATLGQEPFTIESPLYQPHDLLKIEDDNRGHDGVAVDLVVEPAIQRYGDRFGRNYQSGSILVPGTVFLTGRQPIPVRASTAQHSNMFTSAESSTAEGETVFDSGGISHPWQHLITTSNAEGNPSSDFIQPPWTKNVQEKPPSPLVQKSSSVIADDNKWTVASRPENPIVQPNYHSNVKEPPSSSPRRSQNISSYTFYSSSTAVLNLKTETDQETGTVRRNCLTAGEEPSGTKRERDLRSADEEENNKKVKFFEESMEPRAETRRSQSRTSTLTSTAAQQQQPEKEEGQEKTTQMSEASGQSVEHRRRDTIDLTGDTDVNIEPKME